MKNPLDVLNLNHLRALDALLEDKSVTKAAERLHVTQSAMSHTLRQLRETFDDPLLVRGQGGMAMTPRAERLHRPLRLALMEVGRAISDVPVFDPATATRRFRLSAPDFLSALLMPSLTAMAAIEAPNVRFELMGLRGGMDERALEDGRLDIALGPMAPDAAGLRMRTIYADEYALIARKDHPGITKRISASRYAQLSHVVLSGEAMADDSLHKKLVEQGIERREAVRMPYMLAAPLVVAFSDHVLTAPAQFGRNHAVVYPLQVVPIDFDLPSFEQVAVWHERFDMEPDHKWLRDIITRALKIVGLGDVETLL